MRRRWRVAVVPGVACVALAIAQSNWAQNALTIQFHAFQDSRGITVLAPLVDLDKDFTGRTGLKVKFGVDAISGASDACARCHPDGMQYSRNYVDLSVRHKWGALKVNVGAEISRENFYSSDTAIVSVSRDLNRANTTIAGGYSFSHNRPRLHPSDNIETQFSHDAFGSVTQTLTKSTIVQLAYDFNRLTGYQSSPFLRTSVNGVMQTGVSPDVRNRTAVVARIRQALPADTYLDADYRRYFDNWSLRSNAFSLGLSHDFGPRLMLGVNYRVYDQNGVFFYEKQYVGSPQYYTGDFKLAPFNSGLITGRMVYTPSNGVFGLKQGSALTLQYERYDATSGFQAATFSAGLRVPF